jgi:uncharacterized membrane protein YeaQ/YmgE (transglycosylase-associated protein family)
MRRSTRRREHMGFVSWVVMGAVAGVLARRTVPGPDPGRLIVTLVLGMAGASSGGFVAGVLGGFGATAFSVWSLLASAAGAVVLLGVYGSIVRRTA